MLPQLKPTVGFLCKFSGSNVTHTITYVGKHGFTAGPYSVSTSHSNLFNYIIYGLLHPSTGAILINLKDMQQFYPELFL